MILLDTHTLIWVLTDPGRLSDTARRVIEDEEDQAVSVASFWEIVVKRSLHEIHLGDPLDWWNRAVANSDSRVLPIHSAHVAAVWNLPAIHKDPFDRILIAQAIVEGARIVSRDEVFERYPVTVVW